MRRASTWLAAFSIVATVVGLTGIDPAHAAAFGVTVAGGNGPGSGADQLSWPWAVALDDSGYLYVADTDNDRVQRWAPGATSGVTVAGGHGEGSAANQLANPFGLAVDHSGNLYVTDNDNERVQLWAPGATSGITLGGGHGSEPGEFFQPSGVVVDSAGTVFVADQGNNRVQRWTPSGMSWVIVAGDHGRGSAANQLSDPMGVALDSDGNLYVADSNNSRVQRWAPGATSGVTVAGGNGAGTTANQLGYPGGVAFDGKGNLYVADTFNSRVQRWTPGATSGVTVAGGNGEGSAPNQLSFPFGVLVDSTFNIYVADSDNDRVQKWSGGQVIVPGVASTTEGNSGTTTLAVPVSLSNPSTQTVTVQWTTLPVPGDRPDQADPATDYTPASDTVTFNPGETDKTVPILINGDTQVEPDEYIVVSFHDPTNALIGGFWGLGIGFIANDDHALVAPSAGSVIERNSDTTTLAVPVSLSNPSTQTVTVQWTTVQVAGNRPDQADPATDYTPTSGTVTFSPGETDKTVPILINGDTLDEPDEYIVVSFHDPTNALMGGFWGLGIGFITNDD